MMNFKIQYKMKLKIQNKTKFKIKNKMKKMQLKYSFKIIKWVILRIVLYKNYIYLINNKIKFCIKIWMIEF